MRKFWYFLWGLGIVLLVIALVWQLPFISYVAGMMVAVSSYEYAKLDPL